MAVINVIPVPQIAAAMDEAMAKHGPLTKDPVRACAIMIRESAEALDEALKMTHNLTVTGSLDDLMEKIRTGREDMCTELLQVAATAITIWNNVQEVIRAEAHLDRTRGAVGKRG